MHAVMLVEYDIPPFKIRKPPMVLDCYSDSGEAFETLTGTSYSWESISAMAFHILINKSTSTFLKLWLTNTHRNIQIPSMYKKPAFIINLDENIAYRYGTLEGTWPITVEGMQIVNGIYSGRLLLSHDKFLINDQCNSKYRDERIDTLLKRLPNTGHFEDIKSQVESLKLRGLL